MLYIPGIASEWLNDEVYFTPAHLSPLNESKRQNNSANIHKYTLVTLWNSGIDIIGVIPELCTRYFCIKMSSPVAFWMALCWVAINGRKATKFIPNLCCIHIYNIWNWWDKVRKINMVLLQETTPSNPSKKGPNTTHAYFIKSKASTTVSFRNLI